MGPALLFSPAPFLQTGDVNMRRMKIFAVISSLPLVVLVLFGIARAAVEFSADVVIAPKGDELMKGKVFAKGDKVRQETTEKDETQVMIIRLDKKVTWTITPGEKTYMEMPYQSPDKTFEEWTAEKAKNAKFVGEETVSGVPCEKFETVEEGEKTLIWIPRQFPFPIKIEDSEIIVEYQNIRTGPVDDSLFELPPGYEKTAATTVLQED
jgi:hypothetical protein